MEKTIEAFCDYIDSQFGVQSVITGLCALVVIILIIIGGNILSDLINKNYEKLCDIHNLLNLLNNYVRIKEFSAKCAHEELKKYEVKCPPVKNPPSPRKVDEECVPEWYEIDRNYKKNDGWRYIIFCPGCKQEK